MTRSENPIQESPIQDMHVKNQISDQSSSPTPEMPNSSNNPKKKNSAFITVGAIVFVIVFIGIAFIAMRACSEEAHKPYATGSEYTIEGYVKIADKTEKTYYSNGDRHRSTHYNVKLETTTELPNGETVFESTDSSDYYKVERFSNAPNTLITFTFTSDGYIKSAEKSENDANQNIDGNSSDDIEPLENMSDEEAKNMMLEKWKEQNGKK